MNPVALVETTRGSGETFFTENIHYGSVAVVDRTGRLLASAGDPETIVFSRSTIKPFQATPFVNSGGLEELGITQQELAMMCASHSGESFHVDATLGILNKAQATLSDLKCGCHEPMYFGVTRQVAPAGAAWNASHHNCSGKHAGFLAWCSLHGAKKERYLDPASPLQQAIRQALSIWCDTRSDQLVMGIDGCSAPNYALPLKKLALSYARLADARGGDTAKQLFAAMTTHPQFVSGTGRHDLAFMQARPGDWVAKIGADGVQLMGLRSAGLGIAVKVSDGNQRAVIAATIEVLRQLGQIDDLSLEQNFKDWANPSIVNLMGIHTGAVRPVFALQMH